MSGAVMFGRGSAQRALLELLGTAAGGRATAVVIEGEAGSGKTLLLDWLAEQACGRGFRTVVVRPVEGESDLPLAVMSDVIRSLRASSHDLMPEHREVLAAAAGGLGSASRDRLALGAATLGLLAAAAEPAPLLLLIDDAHWVDPASGQALSFALRRLFADRIAVVLAQRPQHHERIFGPWNCVRIEGLTEADVAALLAELTGVRPAAPVVTRVWRETLGNPLAINHLAARLPAGAIAGDMALPMTLPLQEVARRTFSGLVLALPPGTRAALTIVAVAGSQAARLASLGLTELSLDADDLLPAEQAGLIMGAGGSPDFAHPLYRAAALDVAGPAEVRRAHTALSAAARGRDSQRHAWHLGHSVLGTDEEAAAVVERAATAAEARVGAAATLGLRRLALGLSVPGEQYDRRELGVVRALAASGHHGEARDHLQALLERGDVAADVRADAFHELARLLLWDTPLDSQPVAERIPDDLPPRQMAATLSVAALRARNVAEMQRFGDLARHAHDQALLLPRGSAPSVDAEVAETLVLLPTLSLVAESELVVGRHQATVVHEVIGRVTRLLDAAGGREPAASQVRHGLLVMLDDLAGSPVQMLTWTSALHLADRLLSLWMAAARARPASIAYLLMARTELAGWTADLLAGTSAADRAIELTREVGSHSLRGWTHAFAARLSAAMGDEATCRAHGEKATELGARLCEPGPLPWSQHAYAHLLLSTGRAREATEALAPVVELASAVGLHGVRAMPWQPDTIEAFARCGRSEQAEALLSSWRGTMPTDPDSWHRAMYQRCRVLVHGADVVDDLTAELDRGSLCGTPLEEARAQLVAAMALRSRRRPGAATALLRQASATFARLGASGWQATAEAELKDRGGQGTSTAASGDLTPQEMRVAQEIASGVTTREAAARLFCSPKTVEYHLTRVYAKLGVSSRAALAQWFASPRARHRPRAATMGA